MKQENEILGTITLKTDLVTPYGDKFNSGESISVSRTMFDASGGAYYKIFGTRSWISSKLVSVNNLKPIKKRTYRSIL